MKMCSYCGSMIINDICPICHRSSLVTPPTLMSATLFDLNPYLKKRLEWRENIQQHTGVPSIPLDPTRLNPEDLPHKTLPNELDLLRKEKKEKKPEQLEF